MLEKTRKPYTVSEESKMSEMPISKEKAQFHIPELQHRNFRDDQFWKEIPGWASVSRDEFGSHLWQLKNSITKVDQVEKVLGKLATKELMPIFVTDKKLLQ